MRFVYPILNIDLQISDEHPSVLIVENKLEFVRLLSELWGQINGNSGTFLISDGDKALRFDKSVEIIANPFSLDFNGKRILSKIYAELEEISNEFCTEELLTINSNIVSLLDNIERKVSYPLHFNLDLDIKSLLKIYGVKVENKDDDFLNSLISYIKLVHQACNVQLFIFLNLKTFLTTEMIVELYKACRYEEVTIIDIESFDLGKEIEVERYIIVDEDLCFIEI